MWFCNLFDVFDWKKIVWYSAEEFEDIKGVIRNRRSVYISPLILYFRVFSIKRVDVNKDAAKEVVLVVKLK